MDRLHEVFGVKNDNQLGDALQVNRSTLGNWRSRDSVPYTICVDVALERGVSLDWLLTGEGSMYRENGGNTPAEPADSPRERAMLALWRELDEEAQREIQRHAEEKKRLNTLEQRVAELEAVVVAGKRLA